MKYQNMDMQNQNVSLKYKILNLYITKLWHHQSKLYDPIGNFGIDILTRQHRAKFGLLAMTQIASLDYGRYGPS